ncbi:hypothetical protein [Burkholderia cenocepacia]|uniref:hypothetical protein n=1 Tax=Burkholderia cenocepacia TaxID=95486 RepID=UPI0026517A8E|nr:hypothetical protein [Burkholderia cenocepacia]MDN7537024.1 hypothetical protein [Burkholderia cenocepacia]
MTTPEGKIKAKVKLLLKSFEVYQHWPVLRGEGAPTLDCNACAGGYYFTIETKAEGKRPTARQQITMAEARAAGAFVFVVSDEASLLRLKCYLEILLAPEFRGA